MSMYPNSSRIPLEYSTQRDVSLYKFFNQVYAWMFVGLAVTGVVAYIASGVPQIARAFASPGVAVVAALGLFALAWGTQTVAMRVSAALGLVMFMAYAACLGLLLSYIFLVYKVDMLAGAFLMTAGVFGAMSLVGMVTKKDLSGIGGIAVMAAFGLFAGAVINIFLQSSAFSWFITYGILIVFIVITAYQTQQLKEIARATNGSPEMLNRAAVVGSVILYISFINLFLSILRIMGSRK